MEWVIVFKKISEWLLGQQDKQQQLISILVNECNVENGINDKDNPGDPGTLMTEIDPFTFMAILLKKPIVRIQNLTTLLEIIDEDFIFPDDWEEEEFKGLPKVNAQRAWLTVYRYDRDPSAIDELWELFEQASGNEIDDQLFARVISRKMVAPGNLTDALFRSFPDLYFPVDSVTKPWLEENDINIPMNNYLKISSEKKRQNIPLDESDFKDYFNEYQTCMDKVREHEPNKTFSKISHLAYKGLQSDENETGEGDNTDDNNDDNNDDLNTILYGPPGTGKTYSTREKAVCIIDPEWCTERELDTEKGRNELKNKYDELVNQGQIVFTTFHQSFSYEDFIQGISAELGKKGELQYTVKSGIFKQLCDKADENPNEKYILIIDEINRGNISKIFGELITLLEKDKRKGAEEELFVKLPYSNDEDNLFSVPKNVYVIGTMNTADKSLANIDLALRRRFDFEEMPPKYDLLDGRIVEGVDIRQLLDTINQRIEVLIDRDHLIGHSYMLGIDSINGLKKVFEKNIIPLLQEYFYDDWRRIRWVLNDHRKNNENYEFIRKGGNTTVERLFGNDIVGEVNDRRFYINQEAFGKIKSYTGIVNNND